LTKFPGIPGYKIEKKIGESSIAEVYLGVQEDLDRTVAIKILNPGLFQDKTLAEKFIKEAQEDAKFVHPNIANILEVGETGDFHYIVMENLPESLRDKINHRFGIGGDQGGALEIERGAADFTVESPGEKKLDVPEILEIVKQVAWALDYAHKNGVVHKNVRPVNIRFREDGTPTIVDFFISKVLAPASRDELKDRGITYGSPHYASPEHALRKPLDGRTDIYSLGVVFYEMLTGEVPYKAEETIAIENQHIMEPVPQLPGDLKTYQTLLERMMAKEPEERIAAGIELVQLIDELNYKSPGRTRAQRKAEPHAQQVPPLKEVPPMEQEIPLEEVPLQEDALPLEDRIDNLEKMLEDEEKKGRKKKRLMKEPEREKRGFSIQLPSPKILVPIVGAIVVIAVVVLFVLKPFSPGDEADIVSQSEVGRQKEKKAAAPQKPLSKEEQEEQKKKDLQFQHKFRIAQRFFNSGKFQQAKEKLEEAGKFKTTSASKQLAGKIDAKLAEKKDHDAFKKALAANASAALEGYLQQFPSGLHLKEAEEKLKILKKEEKKRETERKRMLAAMIKLRSQFKDLPVEDVKNMLINRGFFEKYYNKSGDFKNHFEVEAVNTDKIVKDLATGLIWHQSGSEDYMKYGKTARWIAELNQKGYAGFSDWRLPTVEEAASLLEKEESLIGLFIDPVFSREQRYIWTGDTFGKFKAWAVDFFSGDVTKVELKTNAYVRPVRKMK
jgi:serine/threonine protein kinase